MEGLNYFQLYKEILNKTREGVCIIDKNCKIVFWNTEAERILGIKQNEAIGTYCTEEKYVHFNDEGQRLNSGFPLSEVLKGEDQYDNSAFLKHREGRILPVNIRVVPIKEGEEIVGAAEFFDDDWEKLKLIKTLDSVRSLAFQDRLTGLANRHYLQTFLETMIAEQDKLMLSFAVAIFDVDNLKKINDNYGHAVGDDVLISISKQVSEMVRISDLVGRWGGDEFLIILTGIKAENLFKTVEKIRKTIEEMQFKKTGVDIKTTISIGATLFRPEDTPDSILRRADLLLYKSKSAGRNLTIINEND